MDWPTAKEVLAPPHVAGMALEEFRGLLRTFVAEAVEVTPDIETQMLSIMRERADGTIAPRLARSNHFRILHAIWEQDPDALWVRVRAPTLAIAAHGARAQEREWERRAGVGAQGAGAGTRSAGDDRVDARHPRPAPLQHPEALARRIDRFARTDVG